MDVMSPHEVFIKELGRVPRSDRSRDRGAKQESVEKREKQKRGKKMEKREKKKKPKRRKRKARNEKRRGHGNILV